jgi:hypothetical protein
MGKQVRFYMLAADEQAFLQFVCQNQAVRLLSARSSGPKMQILEDPFTLFQRRVQLDIILLWNTAFPLRDSDIKEARLKAYSQELGDHVETGEVAYYVDRLHAPVIEFSPSFLRTDSSLVKGRIWAEMHVWEGEVLTYKGKEFEAWYDQLARWLRRKFCRIEGQDGYLGRQALEWYLQGGKLDK